MTETASAEIRIFDNRETLAQHAAEWICTLALASDRTFGVCLAGGSTPRRLYELLAQTPIVKHFPWERVHWFWGDERFVPHDDPDSNYRMARDAFLSRVPVPDENIHAIPTEGLSPEQAATTYEATLKRFYRADAIEPNRPLFDITLLGIGEDGHTASLFPGQQVLKERFRWAVEVIGPKSDWRITLTYPVLDSSRDVVFLATGVEKRDVVTGAQSGKQNFPAACIHPVGRLHWFIDRAAAGGSET